MYEENNLPSPADRKLEMARMTAGHEASLVDKGEFVKQGDIQEGKETQGGGDQETEPHIGSKSKHRSRRLPRGWGKGNNGVLPAKDSLEV